MGSIESAEALHRGALLQLKLAHDLNVIVLSHSLCLLIGCAKFGRRKPANIPQTQT